MCAGDGKITVGYPYFFILYRYIGISRSSKKKDIKVWQKATSNCTLNAYISFV